MYGIRARTRASHEAAVRSVGQVGGAFVAIEIGVALRPGDADRGERSPVHQVAFVGRVPLHDWLGGAVHAAVVMIRADVMPPGLDASREALDHPHARFGGRLAGHAEGSAALPGTWPWISGASLSQPSTPCTSLPVSAFCWKPPVAARLVIEKHHRGALENRLAVAKRPALRRDRSRCSCRTKGSRDRRRLSSRGCSDPKPRSGARSSSRSIGGRLGRSNRASSGARRRPSRGTCGHSCRSSRCCRVRGRSNCCR